MAVPLGTVDGHVVLDDFKAAELQDEQYFSCINIFLIAVQRFGACPHQNLPRGVRFFSDFESGFRKWNGATGNL